MLANAETGFRCLKGENAECNRRLTDFQRDFLAVTGGLCYDHDSGREDFMLRKSLASRVFVIEE